MWGAIFAPALARHGHAARRAAGNDGFCEGAERVDAGAVDAERNECRSRIDTRL
jgi:hypothetical protein